MFEDKTFEVILGDMLTYVADRYPEVDTREGSIIYTALAPIALELETAYHQMEMVLEETFIETASKEYLAKLGNQVGVPINEATCGHFKGEFDVDLEIGTRFNLNIFNYNVVTKLSDPTEDNPYYTFELVCETEGAEPNSYLGDLTPITFVANLSHAQLTEVVIYGEDEEDTEVYRYRIQTHINESSIDGNVAQYKEWLDTYPDGGIGKYRITPCWNGANTVKVTILNSEDTVASDELVADVQEYLDPNSEGMGNGQAPIGAIVTVDTVTEVPVVINCQLTLKKDYSSTDDVQTSVDNYLKSTALDKYTIGYMPISAAIYNCESVEEVNSLTVTINGTIMDTETTPFIDSVTIDDDCIAVLDVENSVWGV